MTILEAIKSTVGGYPLPDNTYLRVLTDRGLSPTATYTGRTSDFELATADLYMVLATSATVSEGGYSVSISDKSTLTRQAEAIYTKYGESSGSSPRARSMTHRW